MNTTIRTKLYTAASCVIATAALCATLSATARAEDVPTKTVGFSDLDINKSDGAKTLYTRIHAAARDVCEKSTGTDPILRVAFKACVDTAIDKAVKAVNAPMLTQLRFGSSDVRLTSK
jgi:UrcA family protein